MISQKVINSTKCKIIENLLNMKINNEENICISVPYTVIEANETKIYTFFYITTEKIRIDLIKNTIKQGFIDVSFQCIHLLVCQIIKY